MKEHICEAIRRNAFRKGYVVARVLDSCRAQGCSREVFLTDAVQIPVRKFMGKDESNIGFCVGEGSGSKQEGTQSLVNSG